MIRIGLSSSALLTRGSDEVIDFAVAAGFDAIEWAGGAHLRGGDPAAAGSVLMSTLRAGLSVASFAPLYKIEPGHRSGIDTLIKEASWLQAPVIRVYAGSRSASGACGERERLVAELRRLGDLAGRHGVTVCLSLGRNTCLDGYGSAGRLVAEVDHPFVRLAWEPLPGAPAAESDASLAAVAARTGLLLARRCDAEGRGGPLREEAETWARRLELYRAAETDARMSRFVILGRTGDDDEEALRDDVAFLRGLTGLAPVTAPRPAEVLFA